MLRFRVHGLEIAGMYYLLLPKLNPAQVRILADRLTRNGYSVHASRIIVAKSDGRVIRIDPSGLCWSAADPSDDVLPAIPDILAVPKQPVPLARIAEMYFRIGESGGGSVVRFSTRIEHSALWDSLRATGECGLAPDEHMVASRLIGRAGGTVSLITDFPSEGSDVRVLGRRRYFESAMSPLNAESTLRVAGSRGPMNSYLPRDVTLKLSASPSLANENLDQALEGLGEWCYFTPERRESSNRRLGRPQPAPVV